MNDDKLMSDEPEPPLVRQMAGAWFDGMAAELMESDEFMELIFQLEPFAGEETPEHGAEVGRELFEGGEQ